MPAFVSLLSYGLSIPLNGFLKERRKREKNVEYPAFNSIEWIPGIAGIAIGQALAFQFH